MFLPIGVSNAIQASSDHVMIVSVLGALRGREPTVVLSLNLSFMPPKFKDNVAGQDAVASIVKNAYIGLTKLWYNLPERNWRE
jgi:hypothetical protein